MKEMLLNAYQKYVRGREFRRQADETAGKIIFRPPSKYWLDREMYWRNINIYISRAADNSLRVEAPRYMANYCDRFARRFRSLQFDERVTSPVDSF